MCAIAGFVGRGLRGTLGRMLSLLRHRGPDDEGMWESADGTVGLAHARLAILDPTPAGRQPMWDASGRYCMVFNGEIYNFRDFIPELEKSGVAVGGNNDTQVLVNLFALMGTRMLPRLNGIFAFAVWDTREQVLVLARDGLGVKPLYVARTPDGLAFASELKALCSLPGVDRSIDPASIAAYIGLGYSPGSGTPVRGIAKWAPGMAGRIDASGRGLHEERFYTRPVGTRANRLGPGESRLGLLPMLDQAVCRQLISDAPLGAFLSGGLDSSAMVASARTAGGRASFPCYTIRDKDQSGGRDGFVEDLPYARRVAKHLGVELREVEVGADHPGDLDKIVWSVDEPQPDPAAMNTFLVAKAARADGVKVLLSGAGGDDLFSGYRRHLAVRSERLWAWLPRSLRRGLRLASGSLPQGSPVGRRAAKLFRHADLPEDQRLAGYFLWLEDEDVRSLFHPDFAASLGDSGNMARIASEALQAGASASPLQRMLFVEQGYFLTDHNLNYTDKMTMAAGVEARVPFLDPDLMEFASRIPDNLRVRGASAKWLLKEVMCSRIPRDIAFRPKAGFGAPWSDWIGGRFAPAFDEYLSSDRIRTQGVFSAEGMRQMIRRHTSGQLDATYPLISALAVDSWLRQFLGAGR